MNAPQFEQFNLSITLNTKQAEFLKAEALRHNEPVEVTASVMLRLGINSTILGGGTHGNRPQR